MPNLQAALGVNAATLDDWFRDWATANYVDGLAGGTVDARYGYKSWNFRSIVGGLKNANGSLAYPVFPLVTRSLANGAPTTASLRGGAAAYFRFSVGAQRQARVVSAGTSGAVPGNVVLSVVRIK